MLAKALNAQLDNVHFFGRTNPHKLKSWTKIPGFSTMHDLNKSLKVFKKELKPDPVISLVCLQGTSSKDWHESINVNLLSVANISEALCSYVQENKLQGDIALIGSASSYLGGKPTYSSTKAALFGLMNSLNMNYENIRTNIILPGVFDGGMIRDWGDNKREIVASRTFAKRVATSSEIADAIVFCMKNNYIAGSVINMTSGQVIIS